MSIRKTLLSETVGGSPVVGRYYGLGDRGFVSLHLVTTGTLSGAWRTDGSNIDGADCLEDPDDAFGVDLTAAWEQTTNEQPIAEPSGSPTSQYVQTTAIGAAYLRVAFTPAGGAGVAIATLVLKD